MNKRITATIAAVMLAAGAYAELVGVSFTATASGTNKVVTAITGAAASATNFAFIESAVITVPASASANIKFFTHGTGAEAQMGEPVYMANDKSNTVARYILPRQNTLSGRMYEDGRMAILGTNATFSIEQVSKSTNVWAIQLMIQR